MTDVQQIPPPHADEPAERQPRRSLFYVSVAAILALLGAWVYILFFYDPGLMYDELADRKFPIAAERVCAAARSQLDQLPPASSASSAEDRAEAVEQSNVILTAMVDDLDPLVPAKPAKARDGVHEWLGDWRTYIEDRDEYVAHLREDPEARFLESPKGKTNKGITRAIDGFAQVNRMESCTTPGDVS